MTKFDMTTYSVTIKKRQLRIVGSYFIGILVALIIGFRILGFDRDYESYQDIYSLSSWVLAQQRYEPGFRMLVEVGHAIGSSFPGFLILIALLSIVPKWRLFGEYSFGYMLPYIYFGSYFLILQDSTAIRVGLAITCVFVGAHLFTLEKRFLGMIMLLLAISFHLQVLSIIVMFGVFTLLERVTPLRRDFYRVAVCVLGVGMIYFAIALFDGYVVDSGLWVGRYLSADDFSGARWYHPMIVQSAILLFLGRNALRSELSLVRISWLMGLFGVITYYALSSIGPLVFRLAEGFLVFNCLWVGYAINIANKRTKLLISWCVLLFALFYFYMYYTDAVRYLRADLLS